MKKLLTIVICLIVLYVPTFSLAAAHLDKTELYAFMSNTTTFNDEARYYGFDWSRVGFRAYKDDFTFRMEYDYSTSLMKYSYIEYSSLLHGWNTTLQFGRHLLPLMYNFPSPVTQPMPRKGYAYNGLDVYGVGIYGSLKRGIFRARLSQYGYENYCADLGIGPLDAFWVKDQAQGLCFKRPISRLINIYALWTNYEHNPDYLNAAFIENSTRINDRVRVYLHQDFGNFAGAFMGGVNCLLFANDEENKVGVFYDSHNLWQMRLTFSLSQMFE